jgi:hypothetical protein
VELRLESDAEARADRHAARVEGAGIPGGVPAVHADLQAGAGERSSTIPMTRWNACYDLPQGTEATSSWPKTSAWPRTCACSTWASRARRTCACSASGDARSPRQRTARAGFKAQRAGPPGRGRTRGRRRRGRDRAPRHAAGHQADRRRCTAVRHAGARERARARAGGAPLRHPDRARLAIEQLFGADASRRRARARNCSASRNWPRTRAPRRRASAACSASRAVRATAASCTGCWNASISASAPTRRRPGS